MKDYTSLPDQEVNGVKPLYKRMFFEYLGYIFREIAFKLNEQPLDGVPFNTRLSYKAYNICCYFYNKAYLFSLEE